MVKESRELLTSLIEGVDTVEKIMDDGKVTLLDLRYLPELLRELKPGLDGVAKIQDEIENASPKELQELAEMGVMLAMKLIQKFK